ncbi:MAG: rhomboid family intramembrane serine protease [Actinobacteria bacterium]|nr:rhomboid family intramembrane serine protease [Actinomycetota bacterium]
MTMYPPQGPSGPTGPYGPQTGGMPPMVCTWHPDRPTNLRCSRCGRPACPSCLTPASVGFHCRACVAESRPAARVAVARTIAGAKHGAQPRITYALIGLNVLVFLAVAAQAGSLSDFRGSSIFNGSLLVPMLVAGGEWWRVVSSGFLHLSVTHIVLNMLALYFIGLGLERVLGAWRYLALYLLSLLGGSASIMLFAGVTSSAAGASGAIFGLMGALLVTLKRLKLDLRQAGIIIAINVIATFAIPGISWQAHVGGLVVGTLVGAAMVYAPAASRTNWQIGTCVVVFVALAAVIVAKDLSLGHWVCFNTTRPDVSCIPPS